MSHQMKQTRYPFGTGLIYASGGSGALSFGNGCITYFTAYETTGSAPAAVALYDGDVNNGLLITRYNLTASQATSESFGLHRVYFTHGLYVTTLSGSVAGSLTAYEDHICLDWLNERHFLDEVKIASLVGTG